MTLPAEAKCPSLTAVTAEGSQRRRRALGLEPGLAVWLAWPAECGGYNILCFEKPLTSAFALPFLKPHVKKFNDPAGDRHPGRRRQECPGPPECQRSGVRGAPVAAARGRATGRAQPTLRPRDSINCWFSALNLGVVCSTEINNWKINTALKGCL